MINSPERQNYSDSLSSKIKDVASKYVQQKASRNARGKLTISNYRS